MKNDRIVFFFSKFLSIESILMIRVNEEPASSHINIFIEVTDFSTSLSYYLSIRLLNVLSGTLYDSMPSWTGITSLPGITYFCQETRTDRRRIEKNRSLFYLWSEYLFRTVRNLMVLHHIYSVNIPFGSLV